VQEILLGKYVNETKVMAEIKTLVIQAMLQMKFDKNV